MSQKTPLAPADADAVLCEVLGMAGQPEAVAEAVGIVERLEVGRHRAPREEWAAYDAAIERALRTVRVVRGYLDGEEEEEPSRSTSTPWSAPTPRACQARWRRRPPA